MVAAREYGRNGEGRGEWKQRGTNLNGRAPPLDVHLRVFNGKKRIYVCACVIRV